MEEQLKDWGENRLIEWLTTFAQGDWPQVVVGPGDDGAELTLPHGRNLVATTDSLVENVHFRWEWITPQKLGWRVMAQNLSDLAAMGATPLAALAAVVLPPTTPVSVVQGIAQGIQEASIAFQTPLVGGNLSRGRECVVGLTLVGTVSPNGSILRKRDEVGDTLWVTGWLGDSRAAYLALELGVQPPPKLLERYVAPTPRIQESWFLRNHAKIHTMIDLSDGLAKDLPRLLRYQGEIWWDQLPLSSELCEFCHSMGWNPAQIAYEGGEDFELLFTSHDPNLWKLRSEFQRRFSIPLTPIGRVATSCSSPPPFSSAP